MKAWNHQAPAAKKLLNKILFSKVSDVKEASLKFAKFDKVVISDEVGLGFLSFFRKLRKKKEILSDPVNPV